MTSVTTESRSRRPRRSKAQPDRAVLFFLRLNLVLAALQFFAASPRFTGRLALGVMVVGDPLRLFLLFATAILYLDWFYESYRALGRAGFAVKYRPGRATISFLVPLVNLVVPWKAMLDLVRGWAPTAVSGPAMRSAKIQLAFFWVLFWWWLGMRVGSVALMDAATADGSLEPADVLLAYSSPIALFEFGWLFLSHSFVQSIQRYRRQSEHDERRA